MSYFNYNKDNLSKWYRTSRKHKLENLTIEIVCANKIFLYAVDAHYTMYIFDW